jgi:hypothetical protein
VDGQISKSLRLTLPSYPAVKLPMMKQLPLARCCCLTRQKMRSFLSFVFFGYPYCYSFASSIATMTTTTTKTTRISFVVVVVVVLDVA